MNKTIASLSLLLLAAAAHPQDSKPTLAQTTAYIKANYRTAIDYFATKETDNDAVYKVEHPRGEITDLAVDFTGTRITFTFHQVLHDSVIGAVKSDDGAVKLDNDEEVLNRQVTISFDLKDIESIEGVTAERVHTLTYDEADEDSLFPMYLVFKAAEGKGAIDYTSNGEAKKYSVVWVPYSTDAKKDDHQALRDLRSQQLYKAFEHLRKLSGAPEPLRF